MAYEKGKPEPGIKAKLLDDRVRGNNDFIQPAINQDHEFTDANASEQSGKHMVVTFKEQSTPGASAANEAYLTAVDSGTQPELEFTSEDGTAITLTSDGSMGSASTDVSVNDATVAGVLNVTGATGVDGNFDVNTDKFTVNATTGDIDIAGILAVTGAINPTSYSTVNGGFLDDDTMAGNSATKVASQQSIKAYVDAIRYVGGAKLDSGSGNLSTSYVEIMSQTDVFSAKKIKFTVSGGFNIRNSSDTLTLRVKTNVGTIFDEEFILSTSVGSGDTNQNNFGFSIADIIPSTDSQDGSVTITIEAKTSNGGSGREASVGFYTLDYCEVD